MVKISLSETYLPSKAEAKFLLIAFSLKVIMLHVLRVNSLESQTKEKKHHSIKTTFKKVLNAHCLLNLLLQMVKEKQSY
jgi:hypothetical protein